MNNHQNMIKGNIASFGALMVEARAVVKEVIEFCQSATEWYIENEDIIHDIPSLANDAQLWWIAVQQLRENQICFTDDLSVELATEMVAAEDIFSFVEDYYFRNNANAFKCLVARCSKDPKMLPYRNLLNQCIDAFDIRHYHLSCLGLFSIIDGLLSDVTQNHNTNFRARINDITKKLERNLNLDEVDRKVLCIGIIVGNSDRPIFANSDFSQTEPTRPNRNWTAHGRSRREFTRFDCLEVLLWIDAILFLDRL